MFLPLYALKTDPARLGIQAGNNVELVTADFIAAHEQDIPATYLYVFDTPAQAQAAVAVLSDQGDENTPSMAFRAANGCGIVVLSMLNSSDYGEIKVHDRRRFSNDAVEGSWTIDKARAAIAIGNTIVPSNMAQALAEIIAEAAVAPGLLVETQREMEKLEGASVSFVSLTQEQLRERYPEAPQLQTLSSELVQYGMAAEAHRDAPTPDPQAMDLRVLQSLSEMMPQAPLPE